MANSLRDAVSEEVARLQRRVDRLHEVLGALHNRKEDAGYCGNVDRFLAKCAAARSRRSTEMKNPGAKATKFQKKVAENLASAHEER